MSDFAKTLGAYMRSYPLMYPEPRDAMVFLMTCRGQWEQGRWVPEGGIPEDARMNYSDLVEHRHEDAPGKLELRAERFKRRFVDEHMDTLAQDPTRVYFRSDFLRDRSLMELVQGKHWVRRWPFLGFPQDIQTDWAQAIDKFHHWLQQTQRSALGVGGSDGSSGNEHAHWPVEAQDLFDAVDMAKATLFPLIHDGADYQTHLRERKAFSERLIQQLMDEDKNQDSHQARKVKP